jgi:hypothetical protein
MNPHYEAWVAATGGGPNWEFMEWIAKQRDLYLTYCINTDASVPILRFSDWLQVVSKRGKRNVETKATNRVSKLPGKNSSTSGNVDGVEKRNARKASNDERN